MIASSYDNFDHNIKRLSSKLYLNGFPKNFVQECIGKVLDKFFTPKVAIPTVRRDEIIMVMPYLGRMSIVLKRDIHNLVRKFYPTIDVKIVFKRGFQISNMFNFKDRLPLKCASGVVYSIKCKQCGQRAAYIGKTINTIHERFFGSNGHLNPRTAESALLEHMNQSENSECGFDFDSIKILDTCNFDYKLKVMESVYLKYEKQTLNTQKYSFPLKLL